MVRNQLMCKYERLQDRHYDLKRNLSLCEEDRALLQICNQELATRCKTLKRQEQAQKHQGHQTEVELKTQRRGMQQRRRNNGLVLFQELLGTHGTFCSAIDWLMNSSANSVQTLLGI